MPGHLHDGFDQRRTSIFMKLINEHFVYLDAIDIQIEELSKRGRPSPKPKSSMANLTPASRNDLIAAAALPSVSVATLSVISISRRDESTLNFESNCQDTERITGRHKFDRRSVDRDSNIAVRHIG